MALSTTATPQNLITDVTTTEATVPDVKATAPSSST
jgi:hypothetical protein